MKKPAHFRCRDFESTSEQGESKVKTCSGWRWRKNTQDETKRSCSVQKHLKHSKSNSYPGPLSYFWAYSHSRSTLERLSHPTWQLGTCLLVLAWATRISSNQRWGFTPSPAFGPLVGPMAMRLHGAWPVESPRWLIGAGDGQLAKHTSSMSVHPRPYLPTPPHTHFQSSSDGTRQTQFPPSRLVKRI